VDLKNDPGFSEVPRPPLSPLDWPKAANSYKPTSQIIRITVPLILGRLQPPNQGDPTPIRPVSFHSMAGFLVLPSALRPLEWEHGLPTDL